MIMENNNNNKYNNNKETSTAITIVVFAAMLGTLVALQLVYMLNGILS